MIRKKIIHWSVFFLMLATPFGAARAVADESTTVESDVETESEILMEDDLVDDTVFVDDTATTLTDSVLPNEWRHFIMDVKWGNVRGEVTVKSEKNYDGKIELSSDKGSITLRKTLLFEKHHTDKERDSIVKERPIVEWKSLILGHWDGVRVVVSGPADATLTITTDEGSLSKTVNEFYHAKGSIVQDLGDNQEIVAKTHKLKQRKFNFVATWGQCSSAATTDASLGVLKDFSGNLTLDSGAKLKVRRPIRFEKRQGDKITGRTKTSVSWNSKVSGGIDGILMNTKVNRQVSTDDTLTISFEGDVNRSFTWPILDIYHKKSIEQKVSLGDNSECVLKIAVKRLSNGKLVKSHDKSAVYQVDNDTLRPILTGSVFEASGFSWDDVEAVDADELENYAVADPINYPDGTLVKGSGAKVFIIAQGRKRHFKNEKAFRRMKYEFDRVKVITNAELKEYPEDSEITESEPQHPDGALLRRKGQSGVFWIRGGKRIPIRSAEIFKANHLSFDDVIEVDNNFVDRIKESSEDLTWPDGTVLQEEENKKFYIMEDGEKRQVFDKDDFESRKIRPNKIKVLKAIELKKVKSGAMLELHK